MPAPPSLPPPGRGHADAGEGEPSALLVIPWSPLLAGGVSTVVRSLHAHLPDAGLRGRIVVSDWDCRTPRHDDEGWVHLRLGAFGDPRPGALAKALPGGTATLLRLRRFLSDSRAGTVNLHYPNLHDLVALALLKRWRLWRGRLVVSFHGTDANAPKTPAQLALWRSGLARADRITACSNALAAEVASTFGLPTARVATAYNGVDRTIFAAAAARRAAAVAGLPGEYLVSVGSYIPRKAHRLLLEAFASLARDWPSLHLVIAGMDGPERPGLLARAAELGLASRLHCLTDLAPPDVAAVMAGAAACVQPSLAEPFGLAVIEAAACGVPVVVSAVGGHLEIVDDGAGGRVFASGDASACARAVHAALADRDASARMAATLLAAVRARFDWAQSVRSYLLG